MLVIAGHIRIDPSKRDVAIAAARALMEATREEAGCVVYKLSADLADPGLFHIFEQWESQAALELHFKAPHMAAFQAEIPKLGLKQMDLKRYEVSKVGPLGG